MRQLLNDSGSDIGKGLVGMGGSGAVLLVSFLPQIEIALRITSLCVGILVGMLTGLSVGLSLIRRWRGIDKGFDPAGRDSDKEGWER